MAENKPADSKRTKISKAQQTTILEVLGASLILGTCLVLMKFAVTYIEFNTRVISAKNEAIAAYDQTLRNVGACADKDNNKTLSERELADCDPNATKLSDVVGSLRYKIYEEMAQNQDLESVARKRNANCYDEDGDRRDFNAMYNLATDDDERRELLQATRICSSLRLISDALPARKNIEALMASLNQLFIISGRDPESMSPRDETTTSDDITISRIIPISFQVNAPSAEIIEILNNIDKSIRNIDITNATIEWNNHGLSLQARANAYFLEPSWQLETVKVVRADQPNNKKGK